MKHESKIINLQYWEDKNEVSNELIIVPVTLVQDLFDYMPDTEDTNKAMIEGYLIRLGFKFQ